MSLFTEAAPAPSLSPKQPQTPYDCSTQTLYDFIMQQCKPGISLTVKDIALPGSPLTIEVPEFVDDSIYDNERKSLFMMIPITQQPSESIATSDTQENQENQEIEIQLIPLLQSMLFNRFLQKEDEKTYDKYRELLPSPDAPEALQQFSAYLLQDRLKFNELESVVSALDRVNITSLIDRESYNIPSYDPTMLYRDDPLRHLRDRSSYKQPDFISTKPSGLFTEHKEFVPIKNFVDSLSTPQTPQTPQTSQTFSESGDTFSLDREIAEFKAAMESFCPEFLQTSAIPNFEVKMSPFTPEKHWRHPHVHQLCYNFFYLSTTTERNKEFSPTGEIVDTTIVVPQLTFIYGYDLATILCEHKNLTESKTMLGKSALYKVSLHNLLDVFLVKDKKDPTLLKRKKDFLDKIFWS